MQGSRRVPIELRRPQRVFTLVAVAVVVADQLTKSLVRVLWAASTPGNPLDRVLGSVVAPAFGSSDSYPLIGDVFRLTFVRNTGAAFGLLPGYRPVFIATSIVVLLVVLAYWFAARPRSPFLVVALALVTGGAVGNLIDRIFIGRVTDFFDLAVVRFPVFNIADSGIVVGVAILVFWLLFSPNEREASKLEPVPQGDEDEGAVTGGDGA